MHIYMYASVCPALQLSTTHDHETTGAGITAFIQTPAPLRPRAVDPGGTTVSLNRERECGDMLGDPLCIVIRLRLSSWKGHAWATFPVKGVSHGPPGSLKVPLAVAWIP